MTRLLAALRRLARRPPPEPAYMQSVQDWVDPMPPHACPVCMGAGLDHRGRAACRDCRGSGLCPACWPPDG